MSILHTVNKSPFEKPALSSCLQHALPGSVVLLLEDGVYGAQAGSAPADQLENARDVRVYAWDRILRREASARMHWRQVLKYWTTKVLSTSLWSATR